MYDLIGEISFWSKLSSYWAVLRAPVDFLIQVMDHYNWWASVGHQYSFFHNNTPLPPSTCWIEQRVHGILTIEEHVKRNIFPIGPQFQILGSTLPYTRQTPAAKKIRAYWQVLAHSVDDYKNAKTCGWCLWWNKHWITIFENTQSPVQPSAPPPPRILGSVSVMLNVNAGVETWYTIKSHRP